MQNDKTNCFFAVARTPSISLHSAARVFAIALAVLGLFEWGTVYVGAAPAALQQSPVEPPAPAQAAQGSRIAFNGDREGQSAPDEIYIINADGTNERRVTMLDHSCNAIAPRWSPNGHQIAFHCFIGTISSQIFVIDVDDGTELIVTKPELGVASFASWSPDGKRIVFQVGSGATARMYIVDLADALAHDELPVGLNSDALTVQPVVGNNPDWSPDGKRIAYNRPGVTGGTIYVREIDDPDPTHEIALATIRSSLARWSPNGRMITFQSTRDAGDNEIYVMSADGEDQTRLTNHSGLDTFPAWSPDGRWIVFHRQLCNPAPQSAPNGSDLFIIPFNGTENDVIRITNGACQGAGGTFDGNSTFSAFPSWSYGN